MESVKHVNQIQIEILLEPNNVALGAMEDLTYVSQYSDGDKNKTCFDNIWVSKNLIQVFQLVAQLKWIDDPILLACANLHQTYETTICAIAMVFQVDRNFPGLSKLFYELCELSTF
jgi:hypothetical protein